MDEGADGGGVRILLHDAERGVDRGLVGHVDAGGDHMRRPGRPGLLGRGGEPALVEVEHGERPAVPGEGERDTPADAALGGGAGDHAGEALDAGLVGG
ncbi:hypothetical protein [Brachybacterium sp. GPGPB12]|uniref:hypothetical protein n=1 Tax=Brachybacterium sp. GPGPB12 TaxID=3023517 RepID=UPI0031342CE2